MLSPSYSPVRFKPHLMLRRSALAVIVTTLLSGTIVLGQLSPTTVSPGQLDSYGLVRGSCPTFSWSLLPGASHYEVEVFRLDQSSGEPQGASVSSQSFEGTVSSWTPDAQDCLDAGEAYAWFVRATVDGQPGDWSQPRLLEVSSVPSGEEIAAAREVLERFLSSGDVDAPHVQAEAGIARLGASARSTRPASAASRAVDPALFGLTLAGSLGGSAAIRGQNTDVSGDANGVVGISSSPDGAGVVAAGAGVGVDLVLDGSTSVQTDTLLSQSGIDRPSAAPETFTIENSGGGGLALNVAGAVTADSFVGDGSALTGVSVDDIECAGCVGATDLGPDSVTGANIQTGSISSSDVADSSISGVDILDSSISGIDILDSSITSADIGSSAVGPSEIATNAVGSSEIASNAVGSSEIASNAVNSSEIASSAVGASEIASSAVGRSELKSIKVVSVECNGLCTDTASTLGLICGSGYSAIAVDCDEVDDDDNEATFSCGGNNVCASHFVDDNDRLGAFCFDQPGWDAQVYCLRD